jgi:hypothetical protein
MRGGYLRGNLKNSKDWGQYSIKDEIYQFEKKSKG